MIIEKIVGNIKTAAADGRRKDSVQLDWYEREKKLLSKVSEGGETIGIRVDKPIEDGDILYQDEDRVIYIDILPTELIHISVHTMQEMGHLCFELGNRHLSLAIREDYVQVPYDEPTYLYLKKLGFEAVKKEEKFLDYTVCHAHAHSHADMHQNGEPHDYE